MNLLTSHCLPACVLASVGMLGSLTNSASALVLDSSFEAASCPPNWFVYRPTGTPWTFVDGSGVTRPPSPFGSPLPPSGVQVAFLQSRLALPHTSEFSQVVTLPAAPSYTLSYLHAGRSTPGFPGNLQYEVLIGSTVIASLSTFSSQPFTLVSIPFTAGTGLQTLTFRVSATAPLVDNTAFFDDVTITGVPTPGTAVLSAFGGLVVLRRRR